MVPRSRSTRSPARDRRWLIAVLALTGVLGAAVLVALITGDDDTADRPQSTLLTATPVEGADGALAVDAVPTDYTITYELVNADGANNVADTAPPPEARTYTTSTETFRVRRPFATHIANLDGRPPGGEVQQTIISDLGLYATAVAGDEEQQVETVLPGAGIGDWRLDAILGDLVDDGTFVARATGASCSAGSARCTAPASPLENYQLTKPTDDDLHRPVRRCRRPAARAGCRGRRGAARAPHRHGGGRCADAHRRATSPSPAPRPASTPAAWY